MKKILMLCPEYSIHSVKWLNAMIARGYEVHSCYCKGQEDKASLVSPQVIRHPLPIKAPYGYYLNIPFLKKIVKETKPDIIHVHRASSYATLARLAKIRCDVLSIWGSDVYEFPFINKYNTRLIEKNLAYANCLASTSGVMAEQSKQFLKDQSRTIHVTPFGVNIDQFNIAPVEHESIVVGTVKTLSVKYGIDTAIKAFGKTLDLLRANGKSEIADTLTYRIYGRGPLKEELQTLIDSLHLENQVTMCGYIQNTEVQKVINSFDIFLLASSSESFGVAAVEAMSCGLPVIATKVPGFSEVVDDGVTGILVDIGDVESMSAALYTLINDKELRDKFGVAGRQKVLDQYNWVNNVSQMERLYEGAN